MIDVKQIPRHTCQFVLATEIVPEEWSGWFWNEVSGGAPFSWGDNDKTLVTASRFLEHCEDVDPAFCECTDEELEEFFTMLKELGETYIDLEN